MKLDEHQRPSIAINLSAILYVDYKINVSDKVINEGLEMVLQEPKYCSDGDIYTTLSFAAKFLKPSIQLGVGRRHQCRCKRIQLPVLCYMSHGIFAIS